MKNVPLSQQFLKSSSMLAYLHEAQNLPHKHLNEKQLAAGLQATARVSCLIARLHSAQAISHYLQPWQEKQAAWCLLLCFNCVLLRDSTTPHHNGYYSTSCSEISTVYQRTEAEFTILQLSLLIWLIESSSQSLTNQILFLGSNVNIINLSFFS